MGRIFRSGSRKYVRPSILTSEKRKIILRKDQYRAFQQNNGSLEISSKTKSVFKLSRNTSGLNSSLSKNSNRSNILRPSNWNINNVSEIDSKEVTNSWINYLENPDSKLEKDRRPIIKSKFQNYVKNGSNKSLIGLDSTQKIKLGDLANERLNLVNNNGFQIPDWGGKDPKLSCILKPLNNKYNNIYRTVDNQSNWSRNSSRMSYKHYENNEKSYYQIK